MDASGLPDFSDRRSRMLGVGGRRGLALSTASTVIVLAALVALFLAAPGSAAVRHTFFNPTDMWRAARFKGLKKPSEGEIGQAIHHPHVVETLEYGLTTTGQYYVVLEFLDGPGLNSVIVARDRRLEGRRVDLLRQAAEALRAVHQAGFIHHDICPRNFVCSKDLTSLKLIDFGLTVPATPEFLKPGNRTGTPNYMPPEVIHRRKNDQRLDIFSFGATAFELCTFELPWARGATGQAALAHDPAIDIRTLRPRIQPRLAEAINRSLIANPDQRLASMDQFLKLLGDLKSEDLPA